MQDLYLDVKSIFLFQNFRKQILVSFPLQVMSVTGNSSIRKNDFFFPLQYGYLVFYFTNLSLFVSNSYFNEWGVSKTQC